MFDIGFWELLLIFGLGLVFLGPERLPRVASKVGRWVGRARRTASQLRRQLEQEINLQDTPTYKKPAPPPPPASPSPTDNKPEPTVAGEPASEPDTPTANEH